MIFQLEQKPFRLPHLERIFFLIPSLLFYREKLAAVFTLVKEVNILDSNDKTNLALLARPELGITFTKIHCWKLTQYEKCVFVDADTLVSPNLLFNIPFVS